MRAKSEKRLLAEKLRFEQGLSYNEISVLTGVSKSTLSSWLREISLTPEQEARLQARLRTNRSTFAARALPINRERYQRAREQAYQAGVNIVDNIPDGTNVDELAFAMLYIGEGSKTGGRVQLASTNPDILKYSLNSLRNLYDIDAQRVSFRLNLVEAARPREKEFKEWWSRKLEFDQEQFRKTQYDSRSRATQVTGNYHGVCTLTYNDTYLQQRILGLGQTYINSKAKQMVAMKIK